MKEVYERVRNKVLFKTITQVSDQVSNGVDSLIFYRLNDIAYVNPGITVVWAHTLIQIEKDLGND